MVFLNTESERAQGPIYIIAYYQENFEQQQINKYPQKINWIDDFVLKISQKDRNR